jgi:hypothetical protein
MSVGGRAQRAAALTALPSRTPACPLAVRAGLVVAVLTVLAASYLAAL